MLLGFIGLGKLGAPCAEVMAEFYSVYGYDLIPKELKGVTLASRINELSICDFIFVAVQTPHDPLYSGETPTNQLTPKDFSYENVRAVLVQLNTVVDPHKTAVVMISTVLPGTIRRELSHLLKYQLIYNPYLVAMGTVNADMRNPEMVIIGTEKGDIDSKVAQLIALYKNICGISVRIVSGTWEEAEAVKIFYNTFISAKISLVNMVQDVAERLGNMNVDVVTTALAESEQRIMSPKYMTAGMGDGGPCHPRDNIALRFLAQQCDLGYDLFGAIMFSREKQAENLADTILDYGKDIIILGKGYKPDTDLTDGSYSLLVGHYLEYKGARVQYYDPYTQDTVLNEVNSPVYLLGYISEWVKQYPYQPNSTIIDPWRSGLKVQPSIKVKQYGNTRE